MDLARTGLASSTERLGAASSAVHTQPWNPYLPLVSFVVVLLSAWAVLDGDHRLLIPLVAASTLCAQTHVPYLSLSVALCAVAFVAVGFAWNPSEGLKLFYSADGPDGIAGPLFLWFLIFANPIILLALWRTWVERRDRKLKEKI